MSNAQGIWIVMGIVLAVVSIGIWSMISSMMKPPTVEQKNTNAAFARRGKHYQDALHWQKQTGGNETGLYNLSILYMRHYSKAVEWQDKSGGNLRGRALSDAYVIFLKKLAKEKPANLVQN